MKLLLGVLVISFVALNVQQTGAVKNDLTCTLCMTLMEILDATITDPTNEEQVAEFLDQICNVLPSSLQIECHTLVTEYVDDIIELLVNQYLAPKDICDALTLCP